jgi:uncharacterized phage-associated protein
MANVFDVAKYILQKTGKISTWKLQKLCYYAQAWSIVWTGIPLFNEEFEAWRNGPVCPELFRQHKGMYNIDAETLIAGDSCNLTDDEKDSIESVLDVYGKWQPYQLAEQTHYEAPWRDARENLGVLEHGHNVISKGAMSDYYGAL